IGVLLTGFDCDDLIGPAEFLGPSHAGTGKEPQLPLRRFPGKEPASFFVLEISLAGERIERLDEIRQEELQHRDRIAAVKPVLLAHLPVARSSCSKRLSRSPSSRPL